MVRKLEVQETIPKTTRRVRKLGVKEVIPKTTRRKMADKIAIKKKKLDIECFWSVFDQPVYEETEIE